ncbi:MAG TPA: anti-sigma factor [Thermoanaerobaculia bacterium]|nr:anti-sigma factor [Thermoanaerobaculia bacterium]
MITCRELITFLADYLDGVLPAAKNAEFERHLAICDSCVEYIATYREAIRMAKAVEDVPIEDPPAELVVAILASISGSA